MSVLFVLTPVAFLLLVVTVAGYHWAAKRGQFDDLTTPALRMLHDDPPAPSDEAPAEASPEDSRR